ncbi:MAG TPA: hypothetical protein VGF95_14300 [Solirubrobacteraceae bacterium]|jgi:hypothetical protein
MDGSKPIRTTSGGTITVEGDQGRIFLEVIGDGELTVDEAYKVAAMIAGRALLVENEPPCHCGHCGDGRHSADCALHNDFAFGPCDCKPSAEVQLQEDVAQSNAQASIVASGLIDEHGAMTAKAFGVVDGVRS